MQAKHIKHLAGVAELAKLDFGSAHVIFEAKDDLMTATYSASYSSGQRAWPRPPDIDSDFRVELEAERFAGLCGLFHDDADVAIDIQKNDLRLRSKGNRGAHAVRARRFEVDEKITTTLPEDKVQIAQINRAALIAEVDVAATFVAHSMARPVLNGIRLMAREQHMAIQAFNGYSALFATHVPCKGKPEKVNVVCPREDLVLGLRLSQDESGEDVTLHVTGEGQGLVIQTPRTWFRCALLTGQWPTMDQLRQEHARLRIMVDAEQVRAALAAVKLFESSKAVEIIASGSAALLRTTVTEVGQYITRLRLPPAEKAPPRKEGEPAPPPPKPQDPIPSTWFDIADLGLAQSLGSTFMLALGREPGIPAEIVSGIRRAYITTKFGPQ